MVFIFTDRESQLYVHLHAMDFERRLASGQITYRQSQCDAWTSSMSPFKHRATTPAASSTDALSLSSTRSKIFQARVKMMQDGLPVSTAWPVGVSLPVAVSTANATMLSLSRLAA